MIAWIVQVHVKFNLEPETLFIATNLIDRYTEKVLVKRTEY